MRLVTLMLVVASLTVIPTASAHHADNMFKTATYQIDCSTTTLCRSDNSTLSFFREASLTQTAKNLIWNTLYDKYGYPTVLTLKHENPPAYGGGAETDLVYRIASWIQPSPARATCNDPIDSIKCDQFYISFGNDHWSQRPNVVCHETGHGLGFTHGEQAYPQKSNSDNSLECMSNADNAPYVVGPHMLPQINGTY
jgi:hypothetical protein